MKPKIFIDGSEGTTGLQIHGRLGGMRDIELLTISEEMRKDPKACGALINEADVVFLCLPDDAAREAVKLVENPRTRVIDASTAHRTAPGWVYGFPELCPEQRDHIRAASRLANPGCHATGVIASAAPLIRLGILPADYPLSCHSLTGYSGGGRRMIAQYEAPDRPSELSSPRLYGADMRHKHIPEIVKVCGLTRLPIFLPIVDDYYAGMATTLCLHSALLRKPYGARDIWAALSEYYAGEHFVKVDAFTDEPAFLASNLYAGTDTLGLTVRGDAERIVVTARFDNLGKGAAGAAVQNMNIMLGFGESAGHV